MHINEQHSTPALQGLPVLAQPHAAPALASGMTSGVRPPRTGAPILLPPSTHTAG